MLNVREPGLFQTAGAAASVLEVHLLEWTWCRSDGQLVCTFRISPEGRGVLNVQPRPHGGKAFPILRLPGHLVRTHLHGTLPTSEITRPAQRLEAT